MHNNKLGHTLSSMLVHLTDLLLIETDPAKSRRLYNAHTELTRQLQHLIDSNVPSDTTQYQHTVNELSQFIVKLRTAKKDLWKRKVMIEQLAYIVDVVQHMAKTVL